MRRCAQMADQPARSVEDVRASAFSMQPMVDPYKEAARLKAERAQDAESVAADLWPDAPDTVEFWRAEAVRLALNIGARNTEAMQDFLEEREALRERLGQEWDRRLDTSKSPYDAGWLDALQWVLELLNDGTADER
jgi:hypothetical protein